MRISDWSSDVCSSDLGNYDAYRHYRNDSRYRERRLSREDRVYRGSDGRYYCKHDDGTTGLIVGALGGGVIGTVIAPGGSGLLGTLLGAGAGALVGQGTHTGDARWTKRLRPRRGHKG